MTVRSATPTLAAAILLSGGAPTIRHPRPGGPRPGAPRPPATGS